MTKRKNLSRIVSNEKVLTSKIVYLTSVDPKLPFLYSVVHGVIPNDTAQPNKTSQKEPEWKPKQEEDNNRVFNFSQIEY
ncbi:hypothetical protein BpHYR1_045779 [Brachionus plicatilis]|uniref:Uncharacterized protein n=1 Tax=Brachionus plicatilis TaxID=10195 RepID=A0A3M7RDH1_BRAPC|nr:hypothetical protein BpHYR1_045779 [Brachionus plicatilis]